MTQVADLTFTDDVNLTSAADAKYLYADGTPNKAAIDAALPYVNLMEGGFGATGDGVADDSQPIQDAIDYCIANGNTTLIIPEGTYLLASKATGHAENAIIQAFQGWSGTGTLNIIGQGKAVLTTTLTDPKSMLRFYGPWYNSSVSGLTFRNTGVIGFTEKIGLQVIGSASNDNEDFTVDNCDFEGFSLGMALTGATRTTIKNSRWGNPRGRDDGTSTTTGFPNVGIRVDSGGGGVVRNLRIMNNYYSGYTGEDIVTDAPTSQRPADGFLWGRFDGGIISGNYIEHYFVEGLYGAEWSVGAQTNEGLPITVESNTIVGNFTGDATGAATQAIWGIRWDLENSTIQNNHIREVGTGVLIRPDALRTYAGFVVRGNTITHGPGDRGRGAGVTFDSGALGAVVEAPLMENNIDIHDWTGLTPGTYDVVNFSIAKSTDVRAMGNIAINTNGVYDASNTLTAFGLYSAPRAVLENNRVFGAQHLVKCQGADVSYQTDVIVRGGHWEIADTLRDVSGTNSFATVAVEMEESLIATGVVTTTGIPVYTSNATAITGGLVVGDVYRLSTGQMMVVY
jgi:hypothetical protein